MTETSSAQPSLSTMRLAELQALAGTMGLKGISRMRKSELIAAIRTALDRYLAEFADIPEQAKDIRAAAGEKTPSEHLAYQLGWTQLLLQ